MGKERPIIFSDEMVRAILDGKKTQTRRVANVPAGFAPMKASGKWLASDGSFTSAIRCPYGTPGDQLWVRESYCGKCDPLTSQMLWNEDGNSYQCHYRADGEDVFLDDGDGFVTWNKDGTQASPWKSSIFMPRWASRITLEITDVRVQRVQDISEEDATTEGCPGWCSPTHPDFGTTDGRLPHEEFRDLWDSINAKKPGCSWLDNPWVWALTFKRVLP